MGWFSDSFNDRTKSPPTQGMFESDQAYKDRVYLEGKERIIEDTTGSKPKQGFFESDDTYRSRVAHDANARIVENISGSSPRHGLFESDEHYRSRIHFEADEQVIKGATGSAPRQGLFESTTSYHDRISQEANARIVESATGSAPRQGLFESTDNFQTRVNRASKEIKASSVERKGSNNTYTDVEAYSHSSGPSWGSSAGSSHWPPFTRVAVGIFVIGLLLILANSYQAEQERQRNFERQQAEQRQAIMSHVALASNAVARSEFQTAAEEFRVAYSLAGNNENLQKQIIDAREARFTTVVVPAQGLSAPFQIEVSVDCTLNMSGGCTYITMRESRRVVSNDNNWTAITTTGNRFTPKTLVAFLSQRGRRFGPFQSIDEAPVKLFFESSDGRPKTVFLLDEELPGRKGRRGDLPLRRQGRRSSGSGRRERNVRQAVRTP
jgi:hypothetical protein